MPHNAQPGHEVNGGAVRVLERLRGGEGSVGAVQVELGLASGGTSQHLGALGRAALAESRREGTTVLYRVGDDRVSGLLAARRDIITGQLARRQSALRELGRP
ncbi:MAG TPA: hypothetical protein VFX25_01845 [Streptosporangiaceae bacterium]|nr:hypothetical protein [Streptosporangiaceae bacterium]